MNNFMGKLVKIFLLFCLVIIAGCEASDDDSVSTPESNLPEISTVEPADYATGVNMKSEVKITFSQTMDESTITTETFSFKKNF